MTKLSISIHTPQWGATTTNSQSEWRSTHFNPRTPVGCDVRLASIYSSSSISIHAPQWGATVDAGTFVPKDIFQSTHPSGVRRQDCHGPLGAVNISIHAPQWGATGF